MKRKLFLLIVTLTLVFSLMCGCGTVSGLDGHDGKDLNIYEIYEAANEERKLEGLSEISFLDFLREYLQYDFTYSEQEAAQAIKNRSLMSCVAIFSGFNKYSFGKIETEYHAGGGVIVEMDKSAGDAYILTNCHVVYDDSFANIYADEINISLYGNDELISDYKTAQSIPAEIVGATLTYDLALLKVTDSDIIKNSDAVEATFCEEEEVYIGESVYAVGNPEGCGISLTEGIISKENEIVSLNLSEKYSNTTKEYRVIRTDAAVNGGNSGGGLFNSDGRLVGIVNSKITEDGVENMGFALPASYVKRVYGLLRDGYASKKISAYSLKRSTFPAGYSYTSSAEFDREISRAVIRDKVVVKAGIGSIFSNGDVLTNIKIIDNSGNTVEDMPIKRYFNVDDVLLSARDGYKIEYTVLRKGIEEKITTSPMFDICD